MKQLSLAELIAMTNQEQAETTIIFWSALISEESWEVEPPFAPPEEKGAETGKTCGQPSRITNPV